MTRFDPRISSQGPTPLPSDLSRPNGPASASPVGAFHEQLLGPPQVPSAQALEPTQLDKLRAVQTELRSGVSRGADRREVLVGLVEQRWRARFGRSLPAETAQRIGEQLASDPQVAALYGRLAAVLQRESTETGGVR